MAACIAADEAESDDFREHLDTFLGVAELERPIHIPAAGTPRCLAGIAPAGWFERRHAVQIATRMTPREWERRPLLLVDSETGERWVRVERAGRPICDTSSASEMGHGVLDGFMAELGATRERFEVRRGALHLAMSFYRLAEAD